ncbi:MAG: dihydroorotase [Cytophagales bacterium]|nr:dihydroorotase [Cytophagales bacterium]
MNTLLVNAKIVNEGKVVAGDVLIKDDRIEKIGSHLSSEGRVVDVKGKFLLPGVIDDQVHFREPGLTHKATIFSESRAAVAGGVTSYMEMPNTVPPTFTQELLEQKYQIAARDSLANYSFYMGTSSDNLDEILKTDLSRVCGLKIFMGSSTGNLLVDDPAILERIFSSFSGVIALHCEDEKTIRDNMETFRQQFGEDMPLEYHPQIRSEAGCLASSSFAVSLAKKCGTRIHVLHLSTAVETELFSNVVPLSQKRITAEACIHHLWFNAGDYPRLGMKIKWNPAIKTAIDQQAILKAVLDDRIDVIATDHAPHTLEEKKNTYFKAPAGGPLVQHGLVAMMEFHRQGKISLEKVVEKMCHNPAVLFRIKERGFIREGYFADLVVVDPADPWKVDASNILAKSGWSPFEGQVFQSRVTDTFVSGHHAFASGRFDETRTGQRMTFHTN